MLYSLGLTFIARAKPLVKIPSIWNLPMRTILNEPSTNDDLLRNTQLGFAVERIEWATSYLTSAIEAARRGTATNAHTYVQFARKLLLEAENATSKATEIEAKAHD